jgi:hypothetical protein|uniref:Uncharacterized protein n=1 Tax=Zea mays TaxID=4577 RepID=A0A804R783_MAIZE
MAKSAANRETGYAQGGEDRARRAWTRGARLEQADTWGRTGLGEKLGRTPELAARRGVESREAGAPGRKELQPGAMDCGAEKKTRRHGDPNCDRDVRQGARPSAIGASRGRKKGRAELRTWPGRDDGSCHGRAHGRRAEGACARTRPDSRMSERAGPDTGMAGCTGKKKRREEQRTALVSRGEEIRPSVRGERWRNLHRR